jgi:IclR family transcriptional regulator, mhp operon transcriptional activator
MGVATDAIGIAPEAARQSDTALHTDGEPALKALDRPDTPGRCRTNSRRGSTDRAQRSYPPVEAVCRALDVLRAVNKLRIASVNAIFHETGIPKPTIVRMLETLSAEGYIARDNMCGGYWVTSHVHELTSGYQGLPQVIEASRPFAIDLTRRLKWPIGIGVIDGDAIAVKFWTGSISPWAHRNTLLGERPDLVTTAMGRAYLGFCPAEERERHLRRLRADATFKFGEEDERCLRAVLEQVRIDGYAVRDPRTKPYRTTTIAMPIREGATVHALVNISFFTTAVASADLQEKIIAPLRATTTRIEEAYAFMKSGGLLREESSAAVELGF